MPHPLSNFEVQGVNIKCFDSNGSGFFHFAPVTAVIGKNNSGKSTVVDLIDICIASGKGPIATASQRRGTHQAAIEYKGTLSERSLKGQFPPNTTGGHIGGNHWDFGKKFLERSVTFRCLNGNNIEMIDVDFPEVGYETLHPNIKQSLQRCAEFPLRECTLLRVAAERSVVPEKSETPNPQPNGRGITNLIRFFINNDAQPRDVVEIDLLEDLNTIYAGDNVFDAIMCQENDETGLWEIFLREESKGDIRLSESGSSLQSVFIVLSYLRLVPLLNEINWKRLILALEEPENNLHPALLRRMINFLAHKRDELGFSLVITTHSPVCIDWATSRDDAGIIHVTRDGVNSTCRNVMDYDGRTSILDDLDVRGSDILQSNGVIWVEGPSDRVYIRRWLDLISDEELIEGSHYTFMYYGGKILSHFEAVPETELSTLISMVTLNRNLAVVIDSDRKMQSGSSRKPPMRLNPTKMRLRDEVSDRGGMSWVTEGKEIENYTPLSVWQRVIKSDLKIEHAFVDIPSIASVKAVKATKVALAHLVAENLELADLENHLDLTQRLRELVSHIRRWNSLDR